MDDSPPPRLGAAEWTLLLALGLLWGGSFFFAKIALGGFPPLTLVFGRVAIAALALVLLARATGVALPARAAWPALLVMGALNNAIPFALIFWGQQAIASALAAILNATTPLFTVLVAHAFTRDERLTPARLFGVGLGFAGAVATIGPDALGGLGVALAAQLACLGAALSYGFAGVWGRRFRGQPPLATAAGQLVASSVLILPLAVAVDAPWTLAMPPPGAWAALVALALASTALGYVIYFRILATSGATNVLLVTFLIPVGALALGAGFLGERLEPRHGLGLALIALGLAVLDGRPLKRGSPGTK
jgi:drug/metabolite transporter (DMT)-like permease